MSTPNYLAAQTFINLLPDAEKVKLCKQVLAGVDNKKKTSKQRVKDILKILEKK